MLDHPTARRLREHGGPPPRPLLDEAELKALVLACGADDCGVVSLEAPSLTEEREHALKAFPTARVAVSIVKRMHRGPVRSPARSVANAEFHGASHDVEDVARRVVRELEDRGVQAMNPSVAFPMEMDNFPERGWVISQKLLAEAAGMGRRGLHRSVIHPRYGSFILLGCVLIDAEITAPERPLDYSPCVECKLCVAACPVGAIKPDGYFAFSACYDHNYQQFMGGFANWIEDIADSKSAEDYESKSSYAETVTRWQSLSFGPNYNSAYCIAVCPAGEDILGGYLAAKSAHVEAVVRPLQQKREPVYVTRGSDAEAFVAERYPHKHIRHVRSGARATSVASFLAGMRLGFQRGQAGDLAATYHFTFTGAEPAKATVVIRDRTLSVLAGHAGKADLRVRADARAWVRFLNGRLSIVQALLTRKIVMTGPPALLVRFGKCFPR